MPKWMECTWRREACEKDSCRICGRINRDRRRHIEAGEDPDSWDSVFDDVGRNFKEALQMIKRDAAARGIDITNIDEIQEPPEPEKFLLWRKVSNWHKQLIKLVRQAEHSEELWLGTEEAADLLWYMNTLHAKVYRQLCNRWHMKVGDGYGDFDYEYTQYVLSECLRILGHSLSELIKLDSPQKWGLLVVSGELGKLEQEILKI